LSPLTYVIILSSDKIQNGDVLVLANPCPSGKWSLKRTENQLTKVYLEKWTSKHHGVSMRTLIPTSFTNLFLKLTAGCWFVGGNNLTGALHVVSLQLLPPPPSSLASIKSRIEIFLYQLTQVHLEKWSLKWSERKLNRDKIIKTGLCLST